MGIYYTPPALVDHLLDAVLGRRTPRPPTVLDPAMGDGAFLAAAAERLGRAYPKPGVVARCLHGIDIDPAAVTLARRRLGGRIGKEGRSRLVRGDFLSEELVLPGPFDLIVGNPPWGGWNRTLSRDDKLDLRARFELARGMIDPFALFLERATRLLEPGGRLAMVLPDYFLVKHYSSARRLLLESYQVDELARWGQAFPGVSLDACTVVATRRAHRPRGHVVRCLPEGLAGRIVRTPQSRFAAAPGHLINLAMDARDATLLGRLEERGVPLGEWLEMHEGIHSGNIRGKLFVPPALHRPTTTGTSGTGLLPLLVLGRDEIRPFMLRPAGWRVRWDAGIVDRKKGDYANLGRRQWFESPKILVRRTGDAVVAALDLEGRFASNNLFVALAREGCPLPLEYLEAYLNSSLATWCFRAMQPRQGRPFAELKLRQLNRLPVPVPRGVAGKRAMTRVISIARGMRTPGGRSDGSREAIDKILCALAGLSAADSRRICRKSPANH